MSMLIEMIVEVFKFLMNFIADLFCLVLFVVSLAAVWRIPFLCELHEGNLRMKFRLTALCNFAAMWADLFTLLALPFAVLNWRIYRTYTMVSQSKFDRFFSFEPRGRIFEQAGRFIFFDIPTVFAIVLIHATFWRIPFFYKDVHAEWKKRDGFAFASSDKHYESDFREQIWFSAANSALDVLILPLGIVVVLSGYRIPSVKKTWAEIDGNTSDSAAVKLLRKKAAICMQCLFVLMELPLALLGIVTVLMGFRAKALYEDFFINASGSGKACERRAFILMHFVLSFRDWLCVPLAAPVLASLYRGFFLIKGIIDDVSPWAEAEPKITVTRATVSLPERGSGLIVEVVGTKDANFALASGTPVKLYIRNTKPFWKYVKRAFGGAAESVGQAMLPLTVTPRFFQTEQVQAGTTDVKLTFDFNTHYSSAVIAKNAKKIGGRVEIQIEYGSHDGTLVALAVSLEDFDKHTIENKELEVVDLTKSYSDETRRGKRFCDVFWSAVLWELLWLFIDIFGVLLFVLLHCIPHRIYRVYSSGCEGNDRKKARKRRDTIVDVVASLRRAVHTLPKALENLDGQVAELCATDDEDRKKKKGYSDYYYNRYLRRWKSRRSHFSPQWCTDNVGDYVRTLTAAAEKLGEDNAPVTGLVEDAKLISQQFNTLVISKLDDSSGKLKQHFENLENRNKPVVKRQQKKPDPTTPNSSEGSLSMSYVGDAKQDSLVVRDPDDIAVQKAIELSLEDQKRRQDAEEKHGSSGPYAADALQEPFSAAESQVVPQSAGETTGDERKETTGGAAVVTTTAPLMNPHELVADWYARFDVRMKDLEHSARDANDAYHRQKWCGGKEGWSGLRGTIFYEVKEFAYDIAAVLCFVFVFCTVYRTYPLLASVIREPNKRKACVWALAEVAIDLLYVYKVGIIIFCGFRGIFTLPADFFLYMLQKPSFAIARQVVDHHLRLVIIDILSILSLVIAWDTIRFAVATLVFGVFSPAVMLESAFSRWQTSKLGLSKMSSQNFCTALLTFVIASFWVFGVPFIVAYGVAESSFSSATAVYFGILAAMLGLSSLSAICLRDERIVSIRRSVVSFVQPNFQNAVAVFCMLIETVSLLAIIFSVSRPSLFGDGLGQGLEQASRYVFLTLGENWTYNGIPLGVYLSLGFGMIYFALSAAPIVCGDMLKLRRSHRLIRSPAWVTMMQIFGQALLLFVVRNLTSMLVCSGPNGTVLFSFGRTPCWVDQPRSIAIFSMVLLTYYIPSSLMRNMRYDESMCRGLDIVYPQLYRLLINTSTCLCVSLTAILYDDRESVILVVFFVLLWCNFWSWAYGRVFNSSEGVFCSARSMMVYRRVQYATLLLVCILMMIRLNDGRGVSTWNLIATIVVLAFALVSAIAWHFFAERAMPKEDTVEEAREMLLAIEANLFSRKHALYQSWRYDRNRWRRAVSGATRASQLAFAIKELQQKVFAVYFSPAFLGSIEGWKVKTGNLIDPCDENNTIDVEWELTSSDWMHSLLCCECCDDVCSHCRSDQETDEDDRREQESRERAERDKIAILLEVCIAVRNATATTGFSSSPTHVATTTPE